MISCPYPSIFSGKSESGGTLRSSPIQPVAGFLQTDPYAACCIPCPEAALKRRDPLAPIPIFSTRHAASRTFSPTREAAYFFHRYHTLSEKEMATALSEIGRASGRERGFQ